MYAFSIWHWLVVLIIALLWVVPLALVFRRTGKSGWWALLGFLPPWGVWALWTLALSKWEGDR